MIKVHRGSTQEPPKAWPWRSMLPGDWVSFKGGDIKDARRACKSYASSTGKTMHTATIDETMYVWRHCGDDETATLRQDVKRAAWPWRIMEMDGRFSFEGDAPLEPHEDDILFTYMVGARDGVHVKKKGGKRIRWPWRFLSVGHCVRFTDPDVIEKAKTACHAYAHNGKLNRRFLTRMYQGNLYVWRVA